MQLHFHSVLDDRFRESFPRTQTKPASWQLARMQDKNSETQRYFGANRLSWIRTAGKVLRACGIPGVRSSGMKCIRCILNPWVRTLKWISRCSHCWCSHQSVGTARPQKGCSWLQCIFTFLAVTRNLTWSYTQTWKYEIKVDVIFRSVYTILLIK